MLLSYDHRFVFLKTRKTAATSVEMYLQAAAGLHPAGPLKEPTHALVSGNGIVGMRKVPLDELQALDRQWFHHMPAAMIRSAIGIEMWNSLRKITCLRNPYDRLVSLFFWVKAVLPITQGNEPCLTSTTDFSVIRPMFRDFVTSCTWPTDAEIVEISGQACPDSVIRYEHLAADLQSVCASLGMTAPPSIPVTRVTQHMRPDIPVAEYYDPATIAVVQARMWWAFELGEYPLLPALSSFDLAVA